MIKKYTRNLLLWFFKDLNHKMLCSFAVFMFLGYYSKVRKILLTAKDYNFFDGTNVFITVDFTIDKAWEKEAWMEGNKISVYDSFFDLSAEKPKESIYANFSQEVRRRMAEAPFYYNMSASEDVSSFHIFA